MNPLHLAARHGPYVLIAGLVTGLLLPGLAEPMRPLLPPLVVMLLFITVLRMDPATLVGSLRDLGQGIGVVILFQVLLPMVVLAVGFTGGWMGAPLLLSVLIMMSAPSISGSPNMCLMMGYPPEYAMRLMILGTALLPLTALPVFLLMPELGDFSTVLTATTRLFLTIVAAAGAALVLRMTLLRRLSSEMSLSIEGLANITLAVFVIGLMPSVSATAVTNPAAAAFWIAFACLINFGAQLLAFQLTRKTLPGEKSSAISLIAGNRNIAIFFVALPPEITASIMAFIGAYQIPMYLTPLVMRRLYRNGQA